MILTGLILAAHHWLSGLPDREPLRPSRVQVKFQPVVLDQRDFAPLRLAGAWRLTSAEARLGGVSALAMEHGGLVALTDSGVVIRLPKPPGASGMADFNDLPSGPGDPSYKAARDSEALARDAKGRGWWVTFENRHAAWLFDPDFGRVIEKVPLGQFDWPANKGVEGALSAPGELLLFPENGDQVVKVADGKIKGMALANRYGRLSDATMLPDGRVIVLARTFGPMGFSARLLLLDGSMLRLLARLPLGRLDNPEAIAAETLAGGGTRLWVMTDNDYRWRVPTLLLALDWPG
ncbi:MAG: esterase-like activity of phytase family protein [Sphingomicrobium sp.]